MSSTKKRNNDTGYENQDGIHPEESSLRQTIYVVQSSKRDDEDTEKENETHAAFSTLNQANEAARRIYNKLGPEFGFVYEGDLAAAKASWLETGQRVFRVVHVDPVNGVYSFPKEIRFQASGAISIGLEGKAAEGEELRVWVTTLGVDEDMPEDTNEKPRERSALGDSF